MADEEAPIHPTTTGISPTMVPVATAMMATTATSNGEEMPIVREAGEGMDPTEDALFAMGMVEIIPNTPAMASAKTATNTTSTTTTTTITTAATDGGAVKDSSPPRASTLSNSNPRRPPLPQLPLKINTASSPNWKRKHKRGKRQRLKSRC